MRTSARIALLRQDVREKLRRSILRKPAAAVTEYVPGSQIYFWTPMRDKARYRTGGEWRGPATVLVKEQSKRYFCSWRGRLLLLAPENMRMATREEMMMTEHVKDEVVEAADILRDPVRSNVFQDLRGPPPPRRRIVRRRRPAPAEGQPEENPVRKRAKLMMKGSKSIQKLLKNRLERSRQLPRLRRTPAAAEAPRRSVRRLAAPGAEEREAEPPRTRLKRTPLALEDGQAEAVTQEEVDAILDEPNDEAAEERRRRFAESSRQFQEMQEEWNEHLANMPMHERRQRSLDDVPLSLRKRGFSEDEGEEEPVASKRRRISGSLAASVMHRVTDREDGGDPATSSEWISRYELDLLRRLTGLPLTAARLHHQPRKKFQRPPVRRGKMVSRARTSILIGPRADCYVVEETGKEVTAHPSRKASFEWKGLTMFHKEEENRGHCQEETVYIQLPGGVHEVRLERKEKELFKMLWIEEVKDALLSEAMVLKLKESGKELDPRWFNDEEKAAFEKSDAKEWESWLENKVVRKVSKEEEKNVPRQHIFKAPLRMVRVNKNGGGLLLPLIAKSRLVVPGHRDPHLGQFRTDAPTASLVGTRIAKTIAMARNWNFHSFDISTAFLSGRATQRTIYVRGPAEGLPPVSKFKEGRIQGGQLFQILKSAYGLTESPRLWYLKAKADLEDTPLVELPAARSLFAAQENGKTWAILALHVDDGLLMGDDQDPRFQSLRRQIDQKFKIKEWKRLPMTFLGVKMKFQDGCLLDDMEDYVKEIKVPEDTITDLAAPLNPKQLTCYRQLTMRLRWPAQIAMPHMLYEVSLLAQKVSCATGADYREAKKLHGRFVQEAEAGRAVLKYPPQNGELYLASFFDASLGKEESGRSQLGAIHFMTTTGVKEGPCPSSVIEFTTTKSSRVVRSSMAAESCSMSIAVDRHLYSRLVADMLQFGVSPVSSDWRSKLRTKGGLVTDAKSLFDHLQTTGQIPTERQTMLDLLVCKDLLEGGGFDLWWVPTHRQHGDGLTKRMRNILWEQYIKEGWISLKETEKEAELEKHRKGLRQAQRPRRKEKFKTGSASNKKSTATCTVTAIREQLNILSLGCEEW